jgi:hypothetical protein
MTRRTELELWLAELFNALGLVAFGAVLVLGAWLAGNWR